MKNENNIGLFRKFISILCWICALLCLIGFLAVLCSLAESQRPTTTLLPLISLSSLIGGFGIIGYWLWTGKKNGLLWGSLLIVTGIIFFILARIINPTITRTNDELDGLALLEISATALGVVCPLIVLMSYTFSKKNKTVPPMDEKNVVEEQQPTVHVHVHSTGNGCLVNFIAMIMVMIGIFLFLHAMLGIVGG